MWKGSSTAKLHPGEKAPRVITSTFITSCMVDCILYCSGTSRPIHLHWLSYSRQLYGSGKEYQREMSGWFGWPFTFLRTAVVIVGSLLLPPFSIIILLKYLGRECCILQTEKHMVERKKNCIEKIIYELLRLIFLGNTVFKVYTYKQFKAVCVPHLCYFSEVFEGSTVRLRRSVNH